jgi:hypothetical protein
MKLEITIFNSANPKFVTYEKRFFYARSSTIPML